MYKHFASFAALALVAGSASAQPSIPTGALGSGADALIAGIESGTAALVGEHAPGGGAEGPNGAGSGILGGSDFLADVLNGAGSEARDGATEGGALFGNSLNGGLEGVAGGVAGGGAALAQGISEGSAALVDAIEQGAGQIPDQLPPAGGGGGLPSLPTP